ncbi:Ig domain-containing protein [Dyella sp. 20L07]|uniref:Ig domain-containing protein n=1 Tax=Dyella sp. 20L07 TaxID=3384240 RepID=UPI003D2677FD
MTRRVVLIDIGNGLTLNGILPSVALYNSYSARLTARGGTAPYTYTVTAGSLPSGLYLDAGTGILSGIASTAGSFSVTMRATDMSSASAERSFMLQVIPEPLVVSGHVPDSTVGQPIDYTYYAQGGVPPYVFKVAAGSLPAGWMLDSNGHLSGSTANNGSYLWIVRAVDSAGQQADVVDRTSFAYALLQVTGTYPAGTVGDTYSADLTISGGDGVYTNPVVTTGALPPGLSLSIVGNKLRLRGTLTASGKFNFAVEVHSGDGQTGGTAQSITVTVDTLSFVASSGTTYVSATSQILAIPTQTQVGDLLLAIVMHRSLLTTPPGWVLVNSKTATQNDPGVQMLSVYKRVAQAGDPGTNITWKQESTVRLAVHYHVYRKAGGCDVLQTADNVQNNIANGIITWPATTIAKRGIACMAGTLYQAIANGSPTPMSTSQGTLTTPASVLDNRLGVAYMAVAQNASLSGQFSAAGVTSPLGSQATVAIMTVVG